MLHLHLSICRHGSDIQSLFPLCSVYLKSNYDLANLIGVHLRIDSNHCFIDCTALKHIDPNDDDEDKDFVTIIHSIVLLTSAEAINSIPIGRRLPQ